MSFWEFIVIMGCGVGGFWLVSVGIEAFGSREQVAQASLNDGKPDLHSGRETPRKLMWFEVLGVQPTASIDEIKKA
jgi:hypothetical protein